MIRRAFAVLLLAACSTATPPAPAPVPVTPERVGNLLTILASDEMAGRMTAAPGSARAAAFIADRMQEAGLVPAGDSGWFQRIPIVAAPNGRPTLAASFAARAVFTGFALLVPFNVLLGLAFAVGWVLEGLWLDPRGGVFGTYVQRNALIVGFVMGETSEGEYGVPGTVGWVDSIGVLSDYQRQGVARLLVEELISAMCKVGVCKVYTLVNWRDGDMLGFFDKLGFTPGDMINLERKT